MTRPVHPRSPITGRPDEGMAIRIQSTTTWRDASGVVRPLRLMATEHLISVAGYLRWWVPELREMDAPFEGTHVDYLRSRPLFRGIEAELRRRGFLSGTLYDALASQGRVPWERLS